jgi:hypothetical protein
VLEGDVEVDGDQVFGPVFSQGLRYAPKRFLR